jgi:hypothetical protein
MPWRSSTLSIMCKLGPHTPPLKTAIVQPFGHELAVHGLSIASHHSVMRPPQPANPPLSHYWHLRHRTHDGLGLTPHPSRLAAYGPREVLAIFT